MSLQVDAAQMEAADREIVKLRGERDAAYQAGFRAGIEAAAKWHESRFPKAMAADWYAKQIRAIEPTK